MGVGILRDERCWLPVSGVDDLAGSVAVVTGAGGGIGGALTRDLLARGATVWLVGRRRDALAEVAGGFEPARVRVRPADVTDDAGMDAIVDEIAAEGGGIDLLVHSAGVIRHGTIEQTAVEELDLQYRSNVRAVYRLSQKCIPFLRETRGQIVVFNSSVIFASRTGVATFASTQQALLALTDTLRREVNSDGIRVLSVFPGRTATPRQERLYNLAGREYTPDLLLQPEDIATMVVAAVSLPRTAEVTDIHIRPAMKSY